MHRRQESSRSGNIYSFLWSEITRLAPAAVLLRGPADLNPLHSAGRDLDILLPADRTAVKAFLQQQGFCREYRPEAYLERYQLRVAGHRDPYTIDLYKAQRWGPGFRMAGEKGAQSEVDRLLACLLHPVVDGKGTTYFESHQNGPPWRQSRGLKVRFASPLGRAVWRSSNKTLLTAYLLVTGVIRPDAAMILGNLLRKIAARLWQLTSKPGFEVALLGVDGTGKSSVAKALLELPAPVRIIHMGDRDYTTRVRRLTRKWGLPSPLPQLALLYELLVRRLSGWFSSLRGWVVVYDRHPAERLGPRRRSVKGMIRSLLELQYVWPADVTFWLTGDYAAIHERKREQPVPRLEAMDRRIGEALQRHSIPFRTIDVTKQDLNSVVKLTEDHILSMYRERVSVDHLRGILGAILG